jgi:YD repeat-containing protein
MKTGMSRRSVFATLAAGVLAPFASKLRAAFAPRRQRAATEQSGGQPQPLSVTPYSYDDCGRYVPDIDGERNATIYSYDKHGRLLSVTHLGPADATTYSYDV